MDENILDLDFTKSKENTTDTPVENNTTKEVVDETTDTENDDTEEEVNNTEENGDEPSLPKSTAKPTELKTKAEKVKPKNESMEETMLRYLLTERAPEELEKALAEGKTIHGAWNFVTSMVKAAYIKQNGRINGGCVGNPAVVLDLALKYLRELPEGTTEPEPSYTIKKKKETETSSKTEAKKVVEKVAKKAAKDAKKANDIQLDLFGDLFK